MATTMKGPAAAAKARTRVAVQYREELPSRLQRAIDADSGVLPVDRLFGARDRRVAATDGPNAKLFGATTKGPICRPTNPQPSR